VGGSGAGAEDRRGCARDQAPDLHSLRAGGTRKPIRRRWRPSSPFVVVGAGPTGVELAGALAEIARGHAGPMSSARSTLPGPAHPAGRGVTGAPALSLGSLRGCRPVLEASRRRGADGRRRHRDSTGQCCGAHGGAGRADPRPGLSSGPRGVQASPFGRALAETTGATLDQAGRVIRGTEPQFWLATPRSW